MDTSEFDCPLFVLARDTQQNQMINQSIADSFAHFAVLISSHIPCRLTIVMDKFGLPSCVPLRAGYAFIDLCHTDIGAKTHARHCMLTKLQFIDFYLFHMLGQSD